MRALKWALVAVGLTTVSGLVQAQHRGRHRAAPVVQAPDAGPVIPVGSNFNPDEVIPVPVASVDGMLRQMRVYLFLAPNGSGAFGGANLPAGRRVWALLPSCRATNPDDNRDPCPVDRVAIEAVGRGSATGTDPTGLTAAPDTRRVQVFSVNEVAPRVRVKLFAPGGRVRYEAVVDATRLVDLTVPEGTDPGQGFAFDLTRYPAR
ncbi:MAG: hypothetical protein JNK72_26665 [Myxococcales bacterium]|nr:hypothetical protein [Myxococcales bacterium]